MTVYLDIVFIENMVINYIIIYVTGIISKSKFRQTRIILASTIGAIYSIIYYLLKLKIYSGIILKIFLSIVIIYIAFNSRNLKELFKQVILFYLVSFVFGGATIAIIYMVNTHNITIQNGMLIGNYTIRTILIGIVIAYFVIIIAFKIIKTKITRDNLICEIRVEVNNKIINTKAMVDTGNQLKEPITNIPVIVMEHTLFFNIIPTEILDNMEEILGGNFSNISEKIQMEYIPKFKVIPFTSLGKQNGMLLGIKGNNLVINLENEEKKIDKVVIGIYNKSFTKTGEYRSLIGVEILN